MVIYKIYAYYNIEIYCNIYTVYWESSVEENFHEFWDDHKCFLATVFLANYFRVHMTNNVYTEVHIS